MKKIKFLSVFYTAIFALLLSSCQENFNERYLITENSIEFDDVVSIPVQVGKDYGVVTRTLGNSNAELSFQVNMIGEQSAEDQTFEVRIVGGETTAVENRDFTINGGKSFVIPKGSSKGTIKVQKTATGVGSTVLVLELVGTNKLKVSKNYSKVGVRCVY